MKNKFVQLYILASNIDRRYLQLAYFVFLVAGFIAQSPADGGSTGR